MTVKYFNSHSPRLWTWRIALRTRIANRLNAERNARCRNHGRKIPDWGTASVPWRVQVEAATKALAAYEIADNHRSPATAAMAQHQGRRYELLAEG